MKNKYNNKNKNIYKNKNNYKSDYHFINIVDENKYYNNSFYNLNINVSNIEKAGFGVFSQEFIPKDSIVGYYEGTIINTPFHGDYYFEINESNGIDAGQFPRCYMAMINDARGSLYKNNCKFVIDDKNFLVEIWSIKNIYPGEELFINYGSSYWSW